MGKRLSISQPTVIQTELRPLSESFWIDANGQLEQWYYQNTGVFSPDRQITALRLSPMLSLLDQDTNTSYSSSADPQSASYVDFQNVEWKVKEWNGSTWVETTISSVNSGDPYYTDGDDLIIRKNNYDAAHAINITCRGNYRDPRDTGTTCWIEATTMLVTNMDATQVYPTIDIKNPSARMFNPLKDDPIYEFEAEANWDVLEGQGGTDITEYKVDALGTEKILPANEDMMVNAAPLLDIKYGDTALAQQQFMERQVSGGVVSDIPDGLAKIDNIKGNTVKYIQSFNNSRLSTTYSSITPTLTTVSNGVRVVITGATGESKYFNLNLFLNSNELGLKTGHKYYICDRKNDSRFQLVLGFGNSSIVITGNASIVSPSYNGTDNTYFRYNTSISGNADVVLQPQIFDLTDMGIANLTTVADVEAWLATNIGLKDYYPYTTGKLINYGGFSVKWNQLLNFKKNTVSGVTVEKRNDGWIHCYGTNTSLYVQLGTNVTLEQGHRYATIVYVRGNVPSQLTRISSSYARIQSTINGINIWTSSTSGTVTAQMDFSALNIQIDFDFTYMLIDLTLMFGAGNEPDLAWCDKYLSRDYYDYCAGIDKNILDVAEVKTAGFNKWDEEWEIGYIGGNDGQNLNESTYNTSIRSKNYNVCLPSTTYYGKSMSVNALFIYFYDINKNYISRTNAQNITFVSPSNAAYFRIANYAYGATYNHDICINISDPSRNGTYEPYQAQFEKLPMGIETKFNQFSHNSKDVIPYDAIPVEYIENTQGAFIETDLVPNSDDYVFETKMYLDDYYTNDSWLSWFHAYTGEDANTYRVIRFQSENNKIYVSNHSKAAAGTTVDIQGVGNMYTIRLTPTQIEVNGVTTQLSGIVGNANTRALNIFHRNTHLRVYYFKVYKSGTLIMDLIPVRVGSVGYLYDKVSGNLYGNSGTGSLLCGNDLPHWESFSDMSWITKIGIENFNLWDEEWLKAYISQQDGQSISPITSVLCSPSFIKVSAGTTYYCKMPTDFRLYYYDDSKIFLESEVLSSNTEKTIPSGVAYIRFQLTYSGDYNHDICINESIPAYNGKYLPHGQTMPYFPQGLCNVGSVYDEVKVENGKIKGVVRIGSVDLGSFSYQVTQWNGATAFFPIGFVGISNYRTPANNDTVVNAICPSFVATTRNINYANTAKLPLMSAVDTGFQIRHPTIETESAFINAMSGVRLYYELYTPYEFEIDYPTKGQFEWYGIDGSGNEVPIDTLPVYSQAEQPSGYGQHSSKIRINALYGENIPVILRVKRYPWVNGVLPPKVTKSVAWKTPPLDVIVTSNKGSAVRSEHLTTPTNFTFSAIVNQQGEVISDEKKQENLVFKWYYVKYDANGQAATPVLAGTGLSIQISTNTLKNSTPLQQGAVKQSTNVYCEVYLLGAYHLVNGTYVRSIE